MFGNLTIKARLIFVIGLLSVLAVVIGFLGMRGMSQQMRACVPCTRID